MHELDMEYDNNNDQFIRYGATILDDPMSDEKLIEYYKQQPIKQEIDSDNDEDNGNYCIQEENVFRLKQEPPNKKQRISQTQSQIQSASHRQHQHPAQPNPPESFASIKDTPHQPIIQYNMQPTITAHVSDISPTIRNTNNESPSSNKDTFNDK
mmetsp:Transcript_26285/g.23076  ORF Transcript_26285/g.23076 Transcript_26285/m.23076 type:complete len:154 (-) Transcript_26285:10-471(-)